MADQPNTTINVNIPPAKPVQVPVVVPGQPSQDSTITVPNVTRITIPAPDKA